MNDEQKQLVYECWLEHPTWSHRQIANKTGLSRWQVQRTIQKFLTSVDHKLGQAIASKFLVEFQKASDFWKLQMTELQDMKEHGKKTIYKVNKEGKTYAEEVRLDSSDIIRIMNEQSTRVEKILLLASQGELVQAIKMLANGNGELPQPK